jgi:uncharacterized Zn-binding protein involved in type VI secretion
MLKSARAGDNHSCPLHGGGPVDKPASKDVHTNGKDQARAGDKLKCRRAKADYIVTGSKSVTINGKLAARITDKTMHGAKVGKGGGRIVVGSNDVEIGGDPQGVTLGEPSEGFYYCVEAAEGRNPPPGTKDPKGNELRPHTPGQSYNNCGPESARQLLNRAHPNPPVSQEQLLNSAMAAGRATQVPGNLWASGGTNATGLSGLLSDNGVAASPVRDSSMQSIQQSVAEGKGVIVNVWAAKLWSEASLQSAGLVAGSATGPHWISVVGAEYDETGKLKNLIINDTGTGECTKTVPADKLEKARIPNASDVITTNPVWRD